MKGVVFPKSVRDSQQFVAWVFLILLGYGVVCLPTAGWIGRTGILIGLLVVVTGWQSFGVISEAAYNDVLLLTDLALLTTYWLFMHYSRELKSEPTAVDATLFQISGMVFILYAIWDLTALAGRDTSALATASHLARFAWIVFFTALGFFALGLATSSSWGRTVPGATALRIAGAVVWLVVLVWWQLGRFRAALADDHGAGR